MRCLSCGSEIDEKFNLCPYCGETIRKKTICKKCGANIEQDYQVCPYCGEKQFVNQHITPPEKNNEQPTVTQPSKNENIRVDKNIPINDPKQKSCLVTIFVIILVIIIAIVSAVGINSCSESSAKKKNEASISTEIRKAAPTLTSEDSMTGIKIYVKANDDYEEVNVIVEIADKNGNIIESETLTGYNYKKGNTYTLKMDYSFENILAYSKYTYRVGYYK